MEKNKQDQRNQWLKTLYSEAWGQYTHEEAMSHNKNTFFLSAHGAMLAILTGLASVLIKMEPLTYNCATIYFGALILGFLTILISILGLNINKYWYHVNQAHRSVAIARWLSARAIEVESGVSDIGPASLEHFWRKHKDVSNENYHPFKNISELEEHHIKAHYKVGGYDSISKVIQIINYLWRTIIVCGACSIVFAAWWAWY